MMKKLPFIFLGVLVLVMAIIAVVSFNIGKGAAESIVEDIKLQEATTGSQPLVGGDKDEHGCIGSAGYVWCESKQKCLRVWEETCDESGLTPTIDQSQQIETEIKQALVVKHGDSANTLSIKVTKIEGDYAQGSASEEGVGGGMWFAAKVSGIWNLVWDGNGVITCSSFDKYPDFPVSLVAECYDEASGNMVKR